MSTGFDSSFQGYPLCRGASVTSGPSHPNCKAEGLLQEMADPKTIAATAPRVPSTLRLAVIDRLRAAGISWHGKLTDEAFLSRL